MTFPKISFKFVIVRCTLVAHNFWNACTFEMVFVFELGANYWLVANIFEKISTASTIAVAQKVMPNTVASCSQQLQG